MAITFKQFLINEDAAKNEANSDGLSTQLKSIVNQFLLPVIDDNKEFRKRLLLGREVIHTIEDATKQSISDKGFDVNNFKSRAKSAVINILTPPASESKDHEKYPSIASAFNNKVVGYIANKLKNASGDDVQSTASNMLSGIGEKWNDIARRSAKSEDRNEEKQMSRKYDQLRNRGNNSTRRQTYKNIEKRAERGAK